MTDLFAHLSLDEIYTILNKYSDDRFNEHWSDDIKAISNAKWTVHQLTNKYKYSVAQKAKQSILSALWIMIRNCVIPDSFIILQMVKLISL